MDLRLTGEQEQLVDAFSALYAKHAPSERVREAEPLGFDEGLWTRLQEVGVVAMAVAEDAGGWGASTLDLALVAEQHGRSVAPAPLVEAQVAARLLARTAPDRLGPVLDGERLATVALHPPVDGVARGVPAGAVVDDVAVWTGEQLLLVPAEGAGTYENLGSMPLADVEVPAARDDGAEVLAEGDDARQAFESAVDDWLRLTAAALVGSAARALEIGVEYVKERRAFDVPIGSFQAIAHRLADSAAAVDGARLLALEAAWAADDEPDRAAELAAMAFAFATETARDASARSLHFHGGYGFMMESDIQLHWRRARAWSAVWGEPRAAYRRATDARLGGR
jgi:alkylation response protein AidB-like acyl-CoA dehydrogenase